jgi:hypothetical protein
MRKKCCSEEEVFAFVRTNADEDGLWTGDAETIAAEFHVSEIEAHDALGELCDGGRIERVYACTYAITRWQERDDLGEE